MVLYWHIKQTGGDEMIRGIYSRFICAVLLLCIAGAALFVTPVATYGAEVEFAPLFVTDDAPDEEVD